MYVLFCIFFSCAQHTLFTFHVPTRAKSVNPFSWSNKGRPVLKPQDLKVRILDQFYLPLRLLQLEFLIGIWKCSRESWAVMHHQIHGFPPKSSKISRTQVHILWGGVPPKKTAEILGPNVESAEAHYTKPEDEFRPGKGLNTKFRGEKKSAKVRYTICVVEFRWKPNYTKVQGHRISKFFRQIFSSRSQRKSPQSPQRFVWQKKSETSMQSSEP